MLTFLLWHCIVVLNVSCCLWWLVDGMMDGYLFQLSELDQISAEHSLLSWRVWDNWQIYIGKTIAICRWQSQSHCPAMICWIIICFHIWHKNRTNNLPVIARLMWIICGGFHKLLIIHLCYTTIDQPVVDCCKNMINCAAWQVTQPSKFFALSETLLGCTLWVGAAKCLQVKVANFLTAQIKFIF